MICLLPQKRLKATRTCNDCKLTKFGAHKSIHVKGVCQIFQWDDLDLKLFVKRFLRFCLAFLVFYGVIILLKYVMLITVNKNFTIIITNYTWYRDIIQITGGLPLRLHPIQIRKRDGEKSNALMSQSSHRHQLVFPVLLALSSNQSESSSSCNGSSGSNRYG